MKLLDLSDLYYDNIKVKRIGVYKKDIEPKMKVSDTTLVNKTHSLIKVILTLNCSLEDCLTLSFDTVGVFKIESKDIENIDDELEEAFKSLIPFIRSELALLTSQPGLTPIILPIIEYNNLVKKDDI